MDTPGTILKREREARGLTLKEIATITRIPVSALHHLEDDRYDLFPAEVFAKGFLRNYARELKLSIDDVLLAYNALRQQSRRSELEPRAKEELVVKPVEPTPVPMVLPPPATERVEAASTESGGHSFRFAYLIVLLVVATSLALSILFTGTGEAEENDKRRVRPVSESNEPDKSQWILDDQTLTTPQRESESSESWERPSLPASE